MSTTKIIRANHGKAATAALTEAVTAFKNGDPLTAVIVVVTDVHRVLLLEDALGHAERL